jgi:homoserine O-acetyltransferase
MNLSGWMKGKMLAHDARSGERGQWMRVALARVAAASLVLGGAWPAAAQTPVAPGAPASTWPVPTEGDFVLRDFAFASGERLPELRLHYRTLGTPRRDSRGMVRNAVLIMHGTGGSSANFISPTFAGVLFGPGELLDARRYFIILPDGIGHGGSSRPSEGLHARFPHYNYDDMVRAQYRLITEGLGVNHLRLVMGTSMGGMHTWVWGYTYPTFMDALMPLASAPVQISGRNRMLRRMAIDAIRTDPEWQGGDYTSTPHGLDGALHVLMVMQSSPWQQQRSAPTRDAADSLVERTMRRYREIWDANNLLYAFEASRDYDPSPHLAQIRAPLFAVNSADDLVNPPELGILEREIRRVPHGRFILLPLSERTRGHGTHSLPAVWGNYLSELLGLSERPMP